MPQRETDDVKTAVICVVIILTVVLNVLVMVVIAKFPTLREDRTTVFMFSLSMSDLACGCTAMPISAAVCSSATPSVHYMTGLLPKVHMFCVWWFGFCSLHSLCWMTVCKMVVLLRPYRHEQLFSRNRCYGIVVFTWVLGAALTATKLPVSTGFTTMTCTHYFPLGRGLVAIAVLNYTITIIIPIVVLVYATARIFLVVMRVQSSITAQVGSLDGGTGSSGHITMKAIRSSKNVLIICLSSPVPTSPLLLFILLRHILGNNATPEYFRFGAVWTYSSNSFMNSFLYLFLYATVRRKVVRLFSEMGSFFSNT